MSLRVSLAKVELKREIKEHGPTSCISDGSARKAADISGGQITGNAPTVWSFVFPRPFSSLKNLEVSSLNLWELHLEIRSERVSGKVGPASRGSRSLPIEPRSGNRRSWGKGLVLTVSRKKLSTRLLFQKGSARDPCTKPRLSKEASQCRHGT